MLLKSVSLRRQGGRCLELKSSFRHNTKNSPTYLPRSARQCWGAGSLRRSAGWPSDSIRMERLKSKPWSLRPSFAAGDSVSLMPCSPLWHPSLIFSLIFRVRQHSRCGWEKTPLIVSLIRHVQRLKPDSSIHTDRCCGHRVLHRRLRIECNASDQFGRHDCSGRRS